MPLIGKEKFNNLIEKAYTNGNNALKGVYFSGLSQMVSQTPADKGIARNGWFLSTGTPSQGTRTSKSKKGTASRRQISLMPKYVLNERVYFTNNVPYIGVLEYGGFPSPVKKGSYIKKSKSFEILSINGFSKQVVVLGNTPTGWVRANLIKMKNKIRLL